MTKSKINIKRIKMATVGTSDISIFQNNYTNWLKYKLIESGIVSKSMASCWGAEGCLGNKYILLGPDNGNDVYVRAVEITPVSDFKILSTQGWSAFEITVQNVDLVYNLLKASPFKILGIPSALNDFSPIKAMQINGSANEVVYLTGNTGDRLKSNHPEPTTLIDRIFIMVLAGNDLEKLKQFYMDNFSLDLQGDITLPIKILSDAQGLPEDHNHTISVLVASERGNKIELDQYPDSFPIRPFKKGQLSPGISMATFEVDKIDRISVNFISEPIEVYEGYKAVTFIGPAGERTELIQKI